MTSPAEISSREQYDVLLEQFSALMDQDIEPDTALETDFNQLANALADFEKTLARPGFAVRRINRLRLIYVTNTVSSACLDCPPI